MNKIFKGIITICILLMITGSIMYLGGSGFTKASALSVKSCETLESNEGFVLNIKITNGSSMGYIRDYKMDYKGGDAYLTFYNCFLGPNSKYEAKDEFEIPLPKECERVHFYNGIYEKKDDYKLVLTRDKSTNTFEKQLVTGTGEDKIGYRGVNLTVLDNSDISAFIIFENKSYNTYTYGDDYRIEKFENGEYVEVRTNKEVAFYDMKYTLDKYMVSKNIEVNWMDIYGRLSNGSYRIIKPVVCGNESFSVFAQFEVNEEEKVFDHYEVSRSDKGRFKMVEVSEYADIELIDNVYKEIEDGEKAYVTKEDLDKYYIINKIYEDGFIEKIELFKKDEVTYADNSIIDPELYEGICNLFK